MGERWYQREGREGIQNKWDSGKRVVMYLAPTGAGKTFLFTNIGKENKGNTLFAAHRSELVCQISLALNMWGVPHTIIAPKSVIKWIVSIHWKKHKRSHYLPTSNHYVTSIQTLNARLEYYRPLLESLTMAIMDEGHHVLESNIYGKVLKCAKKANILLATATGIRSDGKGLGSHADGLVDDVVVGPSMRTIIEDGYLTDYLIKSVPSDIDTDGINITAKGDYSMPKLAKAAQRSHIVGDVVDTYMEFTRGMLGATFVTDEDTGLKIAGKFNQYGIPAEFISHKTPNKKRQVLLDAYEERKILQLVNIDLFGEGFDMPSMQVCSYARPSQSYPLVTQHFGRPLRPMWPVDLGMFDMDTTSGRLAAIASGEKPYARLFDHVGNYLDSKHGLPDKKLIWTLDRREKRQDLDPDVIPTRRCDNPMCNNVYERTEPKCPECGTAPKKVVGKGGRCGPEEIDGRLCDLDPDSQARLERAAAMAVQNPDAYRRELVARGCPSIGVERNVRRHEERMEYQSALRGIMNIWRSQGEMQGWSSTESQQRFYYKFGIDMLSAQSLNLADTKRLVDRLIMEGI